MNTTTDHRLSDNDLTVLVERAAEGSWDSATAASSTAKWADVSPMTKNSYRERVLPVIFHGTKALHDLGYRKPRTITTMEELDALPPGSVVLDREGISLHKQHVRGIWNASNHTWDVGREELECGAFPAIVLHEPEAAA